MRGLQNGFVTEGRDLSAETDWFTQLKQEREGGLIAMLPISEINDLTMNLLRLDDESPFFFFITNLGFYAVCEGYGLA